MPIPIIKAALTLLTCRLLKNQKLRKQNIDARLVQPTEIAPEIEEIYRQNRHISFVERFLSDRGYAGLNWNERLRVLDDCVRASERYYRGANDWSPAYHISSPRFGTSTASLPTLSAKCASNFPAGL